MRYSSVHSDFIFDVFKVSYIRSKISQTVHSGPGIVGGIIVFDECCSLSEMIAGGTCSVNWGKF